MHQRFWWVITRVILNCRLICKGGMNVGLLLRKWHCLSLHHRWQRIGTQRVPLTGGRLYDDYYDHNVSGLLEED